MNLIYRLILDFSSSNVPQTNEMIPVFFVLCICTCILQKILVNNINNVNDITLIQFRDEH